MVVFGCLYRLAHDVSRERRGIERGLPAQDRAGDIRHSNADITKARERLGYDPDWSFARGVSAAIDWYRETLT